MRAPVVPDNGKPLSLPPANHFIATNFDIIPEDVTQSTRPLLIKRWDDIADLWHKKDDRFKKPKAIVSCKIYTNDLMFGESPQAIVFTEVWRRSLQEFLREFKYMADQAKLEFSFTLSMDNINLKWSGYNDKLVIFVAETLEKFNSFRDIECRKIFN